MEYHKLVAVTGLSGLFELVSSKSDGGIVRSLEDKSTKFVSNRLHSFSHLESIEIFTQGENVNLVDVFQAMKMNEREREKTIVRRGKRKHKCSATGKTSKQRTHRRVRRAD
jgi:hypothetical protein